ncbi:MAG: FAD-binding oxidoreductase [Pseudomonadota bacterium]|nr:FAD-binding oxidoreductase [Pseudomonadota bacterium]
MNHLRQREEVIALPRPNRIKRGWMPLRVVSITADTHDTKTFSFVDAEAGGRQFDYHAGQYLTFRFDNFNGKPLARSYTISSSPCQADHVSITVKKTTGGKVSNWVYDNLQVGSVLRARGALGKFCYDPETDQQHLYMIAAGSGITPFLSISRQLMLSHASSPQVMSLLVSYRSTQDLIGWQELTQFARQPRFNLHATLTGETHPDFMQGRVNAELLAQVIPQSKAITFMLCGPEAFMQTVSDYLIGQGVALANIKLESFA